MIGIGISIIFDSFLTVDILMIMLLKDNRNHKGCIQMDSYKLVIESWCIKHCL